jgi:hypothetical protein
LFEYFSRFKNSGSGRFADRLIQELVGRHAGNYMDDTMGVIGGSFCSSWLK